METLRVDRFQILFVADAASRNGEVAIGTSEQKDVNVSHRNFGLLASGYYHHVWNSEETRGPTDLAFQASRHSARELVERQRIRAILGAEVSL